MDDQNKPVVVCYGGGVDSTALLVGRYNQGHEAPELIIFADTGGEKPETYAYLDTVDKWLGTIGWPTITRVRYAPPIAPYDSLEGNCLNNETLPGVAFGRHSCAAKWKVQPIDEFIKGISKGSRKSDAWYPAFAAFASGTKVTKLIGFNADPNDAKRCSKDAFSPTGPEAKWFNFEFPLVEWGWTRERCEAEIAKAGLPVPGKSACFFCPSSKKCEIKALIQKHPDLYKRALKIEQNYLDGHNNKDGSTKGLGRRFAWKDVATYSDTVSDVSVSSQPCGPSVPPSRTSVGSLDQTSSTASLRIAPARTVQPSCGHEQAPLSKAAYAPRCAATLARILS